MGWVAWVGGKSVGGSSDRARGRSYVIRRPEMVVDSGEVDRSVRCPSDRVRHRLAVIRGLKRVVYNGEVQVVGWGSEGLSA